MLTQKKMNKIIIINHTPPDNFYINVFQLIKETA